MLSFVINSIDPAKFTSVSGWIERATVGHPHEIVGIHDAKSMCDGYRRGLARSVGDPVVFCHDDIELLMPDLPVRLAQHFERFDVIAPVGTRKLVGMNWAEAGSEHLYGAMTGPQQDGTFRIGYFGGKAREVDGIVGLEGVFIAARRAVALDTGWDAETFDHWHGYDTDFSFRAHLAGWRLGVVLDLPIVHYSKGTYGEGYERSHARFAAKHAGRLETGSSGINILTQIPMPSREAVRAFFDEGDREHWHRESRLRIDRARTSPGMRPRAGLRVEATEAAQDAASRTVYFADPPTRNAACPCRSGKRYKDCHGRLATPEALARSSEASTR